MKTASAPYLVQQNQLQTQPRLFVRFYAIPSFASAVDYAFSRDFSTGEIVQPTTEKLTMLMKVAGVAQSISPELGQSTIGQFTLTFQDRAGEILRHMGQRVLRLNATMTATDPPSGSAFPVIEDPSGFPTTGTLDVFTGGVAERIRYQAYDAVTRRFLDITRAADGTDSAAHAIGDLVQNGEQIRPGTRVQIYAGYADLAESSYMPYIKMLVTSREVATDGITVTIRVADMQRTTRQTIFLQASQDTPTLITGNPLTILLRVLLSTGLGTNGPYDVLSAADGLKVPESFVDVAGIETLRALEFPTETYDYSLVGPQEGKRFLEKDILQSLNCYPFVTQEGKLTIKRYKPFVPPGDIAALLTQQDIISWGWNAGDGNIINIVQFEYEFNQSAGAPGEYGLRQVYTKTASFDRYGAKPRLLIQSMGIQKSEDGQTILDDRAFEVFRRFSEPPAQLTVQCFYRNHLLEPGDLVQVTHPNILNINTGLRGLDDEVFEVVNMSPGFDAGMVTLQLLWVASIAPITPPTSGGEIPLVPPFGPGNFPEVDVIGWWEDFFTILDPSPAVGGKVMPSGNWNGTSPFTLSGKSIGTVIVAGAGTTFAQMSLAKDNGAFARGLWIASSNQALWVRWAQYGTGGGVRFLGLAGNTEVGNSFGPSDALIYDGVYFTHTAGGFIECVCCKLTNPAQPATRVETRITTAISAADGVYHIGKARSSGNGASVEFFIDGVSVGVITTTIPTVNLGPGASGSSFSGAVGLEIDYFGVSVPR